MNLPFLVSVAAAALFLTPQTTAHPPSVSKLTFAWPERVSAVIETTHQRREQTGSSPGAVSSTVMRYRLEVSPDTDGRLLRFSDPEGLHPTNLTHLKAGGADLVDQRWAPAMVVDMRGAD